MHLKKESFWLVPLRERNLTFSNAWWKKGFHIKQVRMHYRINKSGHVALGRFSVGFLNESVSSFNIECLLYARNYSEVGGTATYRTGLNPCLSSYLDCRIRGVTFSFLMCLLRATCKLKMVYEFSGESLSKVNHQWRS